MAQENNQQEASDKSIMSELNNFIKRLLGEVNLTDEQIDARRKDYRKCKKCGEIIDLNELICWKCDASRGQEYDHPGREDLRKYLQKEMQKGPFLLAMAFFITTVGVLITGYIHDSRRGTFPDLLTIVVAAIPALLGIILLIYWLIRKVTDRRPR